MLLVFQFVALSSEPAFRLLALNSVRTSPVASSPKRRQRVRKPRLLFAFRLSSCYSSSMKKYVAEALGTFALVFAGTGAIVIKSSQQRRNYSRRHCPNIRPHRPRDGFTLSGTSPALT